MASLRNNIGNNMG